MTATALIAVVFAVAVAAAFVAVVVGLTVHGDHDDVLGPAAASLGAAMLAVVFLAARRTNGGPP